MIPPAHPQSFPTGNQHSCCALVLPLQAKPLQDACPAPCVVLPMVTQTQAHSWPHVPQAFKPSLPNQAELVAHAVPVELQPDDAVAFKGDCLIPQPCSSCRFSWCCAREGRQELLLLHAGPSPSCSSALWPEQGLAEAGVPKVEGGTTQISALTGPGNTTGHWPLPDKHRSADCQKQPLPCA